MFKILFNIIIDLLATLIQLVLFPLNLTITNLLPDLSTKILNVVNNLSHLFDSMTWALELIPSQVIEVLIFILGVEIAKHTIHFSTHALLKIWNLFQKLKFW